MYHVLKSRLTLHSNKLICSLILMGPICKIRLQIFVCLFVINLFCVIECVKFRDSEI